MSSSESSSSASERPAAGWYADARGGHRWWDGDAWTEHRQSEDGVVWTDSSSADIGSGGKGLEPATSPSPLGTILGLVGSLVLLFSTFSRWMTQSDGRSYNAFERRLPWTLTGADYDNPVAGGGIDAGIFAHGLLYVVLALSALFLVVRASQGRSKSAGGNAVFVGGGALFLTLLNAFMFRSGFSKLNEVVQTTVGVGIGVWLAVLACVAIIASGLLLAQRR